METHSQFRHHILPQQIVVPDKKGGQFVQVQDVIRCEAEGNYTMLYLQQKARILSTKTLGYYEHLLLKYGFVRVHNSHIINLQYAFRYNAGAMGTIIMKDETIIPISKARKALLLSCMNGYRNMKIENH